MYIIVHLTQQNISKGLKKCRYIKYEEKIVLVCPNFYDKMRQKKKIKNNIIIFLPI